MCRQEGSQEEGGWAEKVGGRKTARAPRWRGCRAWTCPQRTRGSGKRPSPRGPNHPSLKNPSKKHEDLTSNNTSTWMFTAALFRVAKLGNQPRRPPACEWTIQVRRAERVSATKRTRDTCHNMEEKQCAQGQRPDSKGHTS